MNYDKINILMNIFKVVAVLCIDSHNSKIPIYNPLLLLKINNIFNNRVKMNIDFSLASGEVTQILHEPNSAHGLGRVNQEMICFRDRSS